MTSMLLHRFENENTFDRRRQRAKLETWSARTLRCNLSPRTTSVFRWI
jgi:hypothetical protein